ncbi:uncharacterized protein LOC134778076 [Penaeus indicus]|uniref:uncharacterized protein LOC134778076 n=1 Tax=Penaeus indicus TaxID=29960 RepID=UPI00300C20BB
MVPKNLRRTPWEAASKRSLPPRQYTRSRRSADKNFEQAASTIRAKVDLPVRVLRGGFPLAAVLEQPDVFFCVQEMNIMKRPHRSWKPVLYDAIILDQFSIVLYLPPSLTAQAWLWDTNENARMRARMYKKVTDSEHIIFLKWITVPLNMIAHRRLTQIGSICTCTGSMRFVLEVEALQKDWLQDSLADSSLASRDPPLLVPLTRHSGSSFPVPPVSVPSVPESDPLLPALSHRSHGYALLRFPVSLQHEMKMKLSLLVLAGLVAMATSMTVSMKEAAELPEELKPIVPGGSWFDDMAVERLRKKHEELRELGHLESHEHSDDDEEMFIMAKLGSHQVVKLPEEEREAAEKLHDHHQHHDHPATQNTREAMRSFLRQHTFQKKKIASLHEHDHEDSEAGSGPEVAASKEFMEVYERELKKFFSNFMSAMLQAEVGGVRIENRSEEDKDSLTGRPNAVASP